METSIPGPVLRRFRLLTGTPLSHLAQAGQLELTALWRSERGLRPMTSTEEGAYLRALVLTTLDRTRRAMQE